MTRGRRYIQAMKHLAWFCALCLTACVDTAPDDQQTGRIPQPGLTDLAETPDELAERASVIFLAAHPDPAEEVVFCCADEMCAEDELCDFDDGFICAPR